METEKNENDSAERAAPFLFPAFAKRAGKKKKRRTVSGAPNVGRHGMGGKHTRRRTHPFSSYEECSGGGGIHRPPRPLASLSFLLRSRTAHHLPSTILFLHRAADPVRAGDDSTGPLSRRSRDEGILVPVRIAIADGLLGRGWARPQPTPSFSSAGGLAQPSCFFGGRGWEVVRGVGTPFRHRTDRMHRKRDQTSVDPRVALPGAFPLLHISMKIKIIII